MQGNLAIFVGYLVLAAASIDGWLAILVVALVAAAVAIIGVRQVRRSGQ
jgi:hypothetical protein